MACGFIIRRAKTADTRCTMRPAPVLSNRDVAARFDDAAATYDSRSNVYAMYRRASALAGHVRGRSLEVGGGTGAVIASLPDRSRAIHSDIAPRMCRLAAKKLGCPSLCFDAEAMPLSDEQVDTLVSAEMIYYLSRPERFLAEAHRVLRPGGRLVLSTTNATMGFLDHGRTVLRKLGFRRMFFDDGSPHFPSIAEVTHALRDAGFAVEDVRHVVVAPFAWCDHVNRFLERTPLRRFSLFVVVVARKFPR